MAAVRDLLFQNTTTHGSAIAVYGTEEGPGVIFLETCIWVIAFIAPVATKQVRESVRPYLLYMYSHTHFFYIMSSEIH